MAEMANVIPTAAIVSTWGNDIRDRTLQRYSSETERDAEHPTPAAGDLSYIASKGDVAVFHGSVWAKIVPPGVILPYGGPTAPTGYVLARGQAVSRTGYDELFAIFGTAYGVGDGSTTFNLPNLQQRFPLGKNPTGTGATLGSTGGAVDHAHTAPAHTHAGPSHSHAGPSHKHSQSITGATFLNIGGAIKAVGLGGTSNVFQGIGQEQEEHYHTIAGSHAHTNSDTNNGGTANTGAGGTGATTSNGGTSTSTSNPPFLTLNYIIKI